MIIFCSNIIYFQFTLYSTKLGKGNNIIPIERKYYKKEKQLKKHRNKNHLRLFLSEELLLL